MVKKVLGGQARNTIFDLLKIILTFLVVNVHIRNVTHGEVNFLEAYGYYAVPLFVSLSFFLMSKYFSQIRLPISVLLPRIKRLVLPLIFWSGVGFLLKPDLISLKNIILQIFTGKVVNTPLYYLIILICLTFIFWLITYLPSRFRTPLYMIIIVTAIILEYAGVNTHFFNLFADEVRKSYGQIVELVKYASLGMLFATLINRSKRRLVLFFLAGFTLILLIFFKFPQPWGYNYSGIKLFLGTIFVLSSVLLIGPTNFPEKINKVIYIMGGYSFGVYLCHIIFFEKLLQIVPEIKYINSLFPFQLLFIYTLGCFAFCYLFDLLTLRKFSFLVK